jgi:glycosyltransferase involved in cell wall biosynthesis
VALERDYPHSPVKTFEAPTQRLLRCEADQFPLIEGYVGAGVGNKLSRLMDELVEDFSVKLRSSALVSCESPLTVVLPNFNHARFLPHALQALLAQTRPANEVIIIDDASTDDSIEVIERYLPKIGNAKLVRNEKNVGVVCNMNTGLRMAQGSLLAFCAADDVVYPTFFERILKLLHEFPHAAFASARTAIIDDEGTRTSVLSHPVPLNEPGFIGPQAAARHLMRDDAWFTGNATIFRRAPLAEIGGFPEDLSAFTDGYASRVLAVKYGACFTPEILVAWRRMEGGMAWSCVDDIVSANQLAAHAESRMRDSGAPFLPGYPERWKRRFLFGARRFALTNARQKAMSAGRWQFALALAREVIETAWLFVTLRPQDTVVVLHRWLKKMENRK